MLWSTQLLHLLLLTLLISPVGSEAQTATFGLENVHFPDGQVDFSAAACEPQASPPTDLQRMISTETSNYDVFLDSEAISFRPYGYFEYPFYVKPRITGQLSPRFCLFKVRVHDQGHFVDRIYDVSFFIEHSGRHENGLIGIPLYSTSAQPVLQVGPLSGPVKISMGATQIYLPTKNLSPNLPVEIKGITAVAENPSIWQLPPQAALTIRDHMLQPGQTLGGIQISLVPKFWHALGTSIYPTAPDRSQESIAVLVQYRTRGGIPKLESVVVPIRFAPAFTFWILFVLGTFALILVALLPLMRGLLSVFHKRRSVVLRIESSDGSEIRVEVKPQDEESIRRLLNTLAEKVGGRPK